MATNNMGNISKREAKGFFNRVIGSLGLLNFRLGFTPVAPSICLEDKILFYEEHLNAYKWQVKEEILHELAHHYSPEDSKHGEGFYKVYVYLLNEFVCNKKIGH